MLQETPSELERQIGVARGAVTDVYSKVHGEVQGVVSKWIGVEQAVERAFLTVVSLMCHQLMCIFHGFQVG